MMIMTMKMTRTALQYKSTRTWDEQLNTGKLLEKKQEERSKDGVEG